MNELKKRFYSFLWNFGWVALSMSVGFLVDNLDLLGTTLHFSQATVIFVGLVLTQISKAVSNQMK